MILWLIVVISHDPDDVRPESSRCRLDDGSRRGEQKFHERQPAS